jgi:hypothetical protein
MHARTYRPITNTYCSSTATVICVGTSVLSYTYTDCLVRLCSVFLTQQICWIFILIYRSISANIYVGRGGWVGGFRVVFYHRSLMYATAKGRIPILTEGKRSLSTKTSSRDVLQFSSRKGRVWCDSFKNLKIGCHLFLIK